VKKPPEAFTWIALAGGPDVGAVIGVKVLYEAKSGKPMTAISQSNCDAIVKIVLKLPGPDQCLADVSHSSAITDTSGTA